MSEFKVGQKVQVSPDSKWSFSRTQRQFEEAGYTGAIIVSIDGTPNSAWDYFDAEELSSVETED